MSSKNPAYFDMIEGFINSYTESNGYSPSIREIAAGTGIPRQTAARYLAAMREEGLIDYSGPRSIVTQITKSIRTAGMKTPILGDVSCGIPKYAAENIEEYVVLPVALFGQGDFFLLHANGSSMIDAGISDGDLVLIRRQDAAREGDIVVALVDDEATLKRFYPEPEKHRIRLHPENSAMNDIYVSDCVIQGVAVKVIKDLI